MADKILIDVVTLDSVQCAACGYMMESIAALPDDVQEMIEYKEWSIKNKDGIGKFMELGVKVLPSICIERDIVFPSIIPQYEELIDEMAKRAPTDAMKGESCVPEGSRIPVRQNSGKPCKGRRRVGYAD